MTIDDRPALPDDQLPARDHDPGLVPHVVLFRLRDDATPADRDEVERRFRALAARRTRTARAPTSARCTPAGSRAPRASAAGSSSASC